MSKYSDRSEEERTAEREAYYIRKEALSVAKLAKKTRNQEVWKKHPKLNSLAKLAKAQA